MPLFPFVWQYNNQPIEVLAADVAEIVVNDTNFIPKSNGIGFDNSPIFSNGNVLRTVFNGTNIYNGILEGYVLDASNHVHKFGTLEGGTNFSNLEITDAIGDVKMTSLWQGVTECTWGVRSDIRTLYANGVSVNMSTATLSPLALKVKVDGVNYRVPLYQI